MVGAKGAAEAGHGGPVVGAAVSSRARLRLWQDEQGASVTHRVGTPGHV